MSLISKVYREDKCFVRTNSFQYTWVQLSRMTVRKLKHKISKVTSTVMILNYIPLIPAIYQIRKCDFLQLPYKEIVNAFSNWPKASNQEKGKEYIRTDF